MSQQNSQNNSQQGFQQSLEQNTEKDQISKQDLQENIIQVNEIQTNSNNNLSQSQNQIQNGNSQQQSRLNSKQSNKSFQNEEKISPSKSQLSIKNSLNQMQSSGVMKSSNKSFLLNSQHKRQEQYKDLLKESQIVDQDQIVQQVQKLRYVQCENENHSGNVLNQICIDKKCPNYFQLVCIDCIEDQQSHKHRNNFRGLKKFCENVAENIDELQKGLHQKYQNSQSWYFEIAEQLQEISDQCKEIRKNILLTYKDIINGEPFPEIKKSKELILQVIQNKSAQNLQEVIKDLKEQLQFDGDNAFIKKSKNSQQIHKNIENYQNNIQNNMQQLQEKADIFLRQSYSIEYKPLLWTFRKQNNLQSQSIKENQIGIEFEGTKKLNQFLYSSQFFDQGIHGCKIQINNFNSQKDHLIIGLTTEINKNSDILNLKQTPYGCIFCKDFKNQMIGQPAQYCIGDALQPGQILTMIMDEKTNTFDIALNDSKISYKMQNFYLKGKNLGFFVAWGNSNARISLLESF